MDRIKVGQITGALGLKGEIKVYDYGDEPERYKRYTRIYIDDRMYGLKNARIQKNLVVLLLNEVQDRNAAEKLRGKDVYIDESQLPSLPEGTYYIRDLIGFDVVSEDGVRIGSLKNIVKNTAQPLYVIDMDGKEGYIPGVDEYILGTDVNEKKITVRIIEGLFD
ncbi:MAG: ribosome maturation factor RimM [Clostridiales bacterium]|nr:ribosome maturation factor RimM [Clostridiales bacterium]MDY5976197.1 ribosome maturation factor RimM [Anaerovoracaceae bacterium]